jgi:HK97 family phage major capsid protein
MSARIRALQAKQKAALDAAKAITAAAGDTLNDEQAAAFDGHMAEAATLKAQAERLAALDLAEAGMTAARGSTVEIAEGSTLSVAENVAADPKRGFKSLGDFAADVQRSAISGRPTERLTIGAAAPSTYGNEASGADGGFLIPPEFSQPTSSTCR